MNSHKEEEKELTQLLAGKTVTVMMSDNDRMKVEQASEQSVPISFQGLACMVVDFNLKPNYLVVNLKATEEAINNFTADKIS